MGNLRVEFYDSIRDLGSGKSQMLDMLYSIVEPPETINFVYKGTISNCYVYPDKIKTLAARHPEFLSVKIYKIQPFV